MSRTTALAAALLAATVTAQAGVVAQCENKQNMPMYATDEVVPGECPAGKLLFFYIESGGEVHRGCWNFVYGHIHVIYHNGWEFNYDPQYCVDGPVLIEWKRTHPADAPKTVY